MSAFGLNPLNPKCGPLIPLDTSKYDTHFKNNPSKIQCERLKVPYLFLPPDTNTLKNYDKDQFSFTFIENGIHYVNRNELSIPNRYKLMALFHPELFVPKIFFFIKPVTSLQYAVVWIVRQLFGVKDTNQIIAFISQNNSFIDYFQNFFFLTCDFSKNSCFTLNIEGVDENFELDTYISFIEYLAQSILDDQYLPPVLAELLNLKEQSWSQGYQLIEPKDNQDAFNFFKGGCNLPNTESVQLGYCVFCENFTTNNLYEHWKARKQDLDFCQNKFFILKGGFKCPQCNFETKNKIDLMKHFLTFCSRNPKFCFNCLCETTICTCTRAKIAMLQKLQLFYEKVHKNPDSFFYDKNLPQLSEFLDKRKYDTIAAVWKDKSGIMHRDDKMPQKRSQLLVMVDLESRLNITIPPPENRPESFTTQNTDRPRDTTNSFNCFCGMMIPAATMQLTRDHLRTHQLTFQCTRCSHIGNTIDDVLAHLRTHEHNTYDRSPCSYPVNNECLTGGATTAAKDIVHSLLYHTPTREEYKQWVTTLSNVQLITDNIVHPEGGATVTQPATPPTTETKTAIPKSTVKTHRNITAPSVSTPHAATKNMPPQTSKYQPNIHLPRPGIDMDSWSLDGDETTWPHDPAENKLYPCENERCKAQGITFETQEHLQAHIEDYHCCPECSFCHMNDSILLRHVLTHKTAEKNFHCSYCKASFTTKVALSKHITGIHNLQCNICNERNFPTQENLQLHRETCNRATMGELSSKDPDPVIQLANLVLAANPDQHDKISSLIATQIRNNERQLNPKKFLTKKGLYVELPSFSPTAGRPVPSHRLKNLPQFNPTLGRDRDNLRNHLQLSKVMTSLRQLCIEFSLDEATTVSIFLQTCSDDVISTLNALSPVDMTSLSLESILHTLRDVYYSIDIEAVFLSSSHVQRMTNEDLRSFYIRLMNLLKLASYHLSPSQRPDWIEDTARSQFLKHVPSDFAAMTREEEVKRGKRYGGQEVFANYLEYIKATRRKNDMGIHNLREERPLTPNQRQNTFRDSDRQQDSRRGRGRTNNIRRGRGTSRGTFRGGNATPRGQNRSRNMTTTGRNRDQQYQRSTDGPTRWYRGGRPGRNDGDSRRASDARSRLNVDGPTPRLAVDAIRKSLNLAPTDIVCYLCGRRDHISRRCELYKGVRIQETKCENCLRFYHPTETCQSRIKAINNKEE